MHETRQILTHQSPFRFESCTLHRFAIPIHLPLLIWSAALLFQIRNGLGIVRLFSHFPKLRAQTGSVAPTLLLIRLSDCWKLILTMAISICKLVRSAATRNRLPVAHRKTCRKFFTDTATIQVRQTHMLGPRPYHISPPFVCLLLVAERRYKQRKIPPRQDLFGLRTVCIESIDASLARSYISQLTE